LRILFEESCALPQTSGSVVRLIICLVRATSNSRETNPLVLPCASLLATPNPPLSREQAKERILFLGSEGHSWEMGGTSFVSAYRRGKGVRRLHESVFLPCGVGAIGP
jgi:hypothetical protein